MATQGGAEDRQEQTGHPAPVRPSEVLDSGHEIPSEPAGRYEFYRQLVELALDAQQLKIRRTVGILRTAFFVLAAAIAGFAGNYIVDSLPSFFFALLIGAAAGSIGAILGTFFGSFQIKREKHELIMLDDELKPGSNRKDEA